MIVLPYVPVLPQWIAATPLLMKSRDYLAVADQTEQVRALSPDIAALAKLDIVNSETIVTAPGGVTWITCADFFHRRRAPMRTPQPDRYTAHWLHIGRRDWVRTRCVRNNSVSAVDRCSAQPVAIA